MDMVAIRQASWGIASQLGLAANDALPLLDVSTVTRSKDEIVNRIFGMLALAASAYGLDRRKALTWLEREGSLEILTLADESNAVHGAGRGDVGFVLVLESGSRS